MINENYIDEDDPAFKTAKYAENAERYCIANFDSIEGNEAIFGAIILSQAICDNRNGLMFALNMLNEKLDELDIRTCLNEIESAIMALEAEVADAAARR